MNPTDLLDAYSLMLRIRIAEELAAEYYLQNKIYSFVHFAVGQELAAVATSRACNLEDKFIGNHRSHHHFLAKGGSPYSMFSEMLGKSDGCAKGRGGSMHMFDPSVGFVGSSPILSSALPISLGVAKAIKDEKSSQVAVVFVGDGATEEGNFYESLNLASLWNLPVVIVLEDNHYAVNSPREKRRSEKFEFAKLGGAFGLRYFEYSSDDPLLAFEISERAVAVARQGAPVLLHSKNFRYMAHSSPLLDDEAPYRQEVLREVRESRDPIGIMESLLASEGASFQGIKEKERENLRAELARAVAAPEPKMEELMMGIYG